MKTLKRKEYNEIKGIYKIKSLIDSKVYIGSTKNLYTRNLHHYNSLCGNYHTNFKLQRYVNKYSIDNVEFEIIEIIENIDDLLLKEQYYVDLFDSCKNGFNIVPIVESTTIGYKHTEESKRKIGEKSKNRTHSKETKEKMSKNSIGAHCGESNNNLAKLKNEDVILIKKMLNSGFGIVEISKFFKVNFRTIGNIKYNSRWKHIINNEILSLTEIEYYKNIFKQNKKIRLLSEDSVKYIKYLMENNVDSEKIKKFFKILDHNLKSIRNKKNWKNVKSEFNEEIDREFNNFN